MKKIKLILCVIFITSIAQAQTVEINGSVIAGKDVEGIHVMNKTLNKYTTTNQLGGFTIEAKVQDTIVFSSIQYKFLSVIVSKANVDSKSITVNLIDNVNELDEVTVGKVLTGDLSSDVSNSEAEKPIDFYDVGIPGYTGKKKTQNERKLYEADNGKYVSIGLGVGLNLNKILNGISGRTKRLKNRVKLDQDDEIIRSIREDIAKDFFSVNQLDEILHMDFFYFCADDENFQKRCKDKSPVEVFQFLEEKLKEYKANLNAKD
ncbi:hypothetical protein [Pontimicrobium sp. IMCC45349]|uniref:hypothetical protein n=1 Tax=Pontimicrobium sp. IMCC45349 TaxID=3391574 RepID=UPI0039A1ACC9